MEDFRPRLGPALSAQDRSETFQAGVSEVQAEIEVPSACVIRFRPFVQLDQYNEGRSLWDLMSACPGWALVADGSRQGRVHERGK